MDFTGERFVPDANVGSELEIEHYQRYQAIANLSAGKVVLDAASGEGYGADILARQARQVCGLEIDPRAVAQAKGKYPRPNLNFMQGSVASLPFLHRAFDLVVSFETIEHITSELQEAFLLEIKRVLKPDGMLIMSTPDKHLYSDVPRYKNQFHVQEFCRDEFLGFLSRHFKAVRFLEQTAVLAYLLSDGHEETLRRWPLDEGLQGKYIVALCSDAELPEVQLGAVTMDREDLYHSKVRRVVELQDEIEEKNRHIKIVLSDINACETTISELDRTIKEKDFQSQKTIADLLAKLDACQHRTSAMEAALRESQNQLTHIQATHAWRLIKTLYRWKDKMLSKY